MNRIRCLLGCALAVWALLPCRGAAPPRPPADLYGDPLPPGAVARIGTARLRQGSPCPVGFALGGKVLVTTHGGLRLWDPAGGPGDGGCAGVPVPPHPSDPQQRGAVKRMPAAAIF